MSVIRGFDYRAGTECARTAADWRDDIRRALAEGGFRRVENGETFVHGRSGHLLFEVYDNINVGRRKE